MLRADGLIGVEETHCRPTARDATSVCLPLSALRLQQGLGCMLIRLLICNFSQFEKADFEYGKTAVITATAVEVVGQPVR